MKRPFSDHAFGVASTNATVPLPIPEAAPVGKYRIVSRLLLKSKDGKQKTLLARTSTSFDVIARK